MQKLSKMTTAQSEVSEYVSHVGVQHARGRTHSLRQEHRTEGTERRYDRQEVGSDVAQLELMKRVHHVEVDEEPELGELV